MGAWTDAGFEAQFTGAARHGVRGAANNPPALVVEVVNADASGVSDTFFKLAGGFHIELRSELHAGMMKFWALGVTK